MKNASLHDQIYQLNCFLMLLFLTSSFYNKMLSPFHHCFVFFTQNWSDSPLDGQSIPDLSIIGWFVNVFVSLCLGVFCVFLSLCHCVLVGQVIISIICFTSVLKRDDSKVYHHGNNTNILSQVCCTIIAITSISLALPVPWEYTEWEVQ